MKYALSIAIFLGAALLASVASAGDKDKEAKETFDRAVKLFRQSQYEQAADEFRRAYSLKPTNSLLYNIGQSEAAAKRYGLAYDAFEEYLSLGGDELTEQRHNEVLAELDRLSKMIGSVEITAPGGSTVLVDGRDCGKAPLPGKIKLAIGVVHTVEVQKDGKTIHQSNLKVSFGETASVEVKDEEAEEAKAQPAAAPAPEQAKPATETASPSTTEPETGASDRYKPLKIAGLVSLSTGGAMLGAAIATGAVALTKNGDLNDKCTGETCDDSYSAESSTRDILALTTDVLIGVGATAAVVGTVLFVVGKKKSKHGETALIPTPIIGPKTAGAGIVLEF